MKKVLKKIFWFFVLVFSSIIFGVLKVLVFALKISINEKKYEPTSHEIRCGQKLLFSDKYFVPDEKQHK
jgi:hypothetical protein